jgi:hypothetical protein
LAGGSFHVNQTIADVVTLPSGREPEVMEVRSDRQLDVLIHHIANELANESAQLVAQRLSVL